MSERHYHMIIVGTGFTGLGMAIQLKRSGFNDFLLLERAEEVGGTWRENTYPGCACDVESLIYSFSFYPNPRWSRVWSPQPEILDYLKRAADHFGIRPHIRFAHNFEGASWNGAAQRWEIKTSKGDFSARYLASATGALSEPTVPALPGLSEFKGKTFHSARWDHNYDLTGKRVAVVGTGASAIQFVPAIQPKVSKLFLFQRTAPWIIPHKNLYLTEKQHRRFERFPLWQKLQRLRLYVTREFIGLSFRHDFFTRISEKFARSYLQRKVADPQLRRKLTPSYRMGCKRILISSAYYPALTQPNVELITDRIETITATGVRTAAGEYPVDAIILGTGFSLRAIHGAETIRGREGKTLAEVWKGTPRAFVGTTVAGFPNLFLLFGPNTGLGHNSVLLMIEAQIGHVLRALQYLQRNQLTSLEPKSERQLAFVAGVERRMKTTVWTSGCSSWYLDENGVNSSLWPGSVGSFVRQTHRFRKQDYLFQSNG